MNLRVIYVDVLIAVNVFIDFFLILCTKKSLHLSASYKRMILGAALGGGLSLIALVPKLFFLINIIIDIVGACIIVLAAFGRCSGLNYIKRVAIYFSYSFLFCGIMMFICSTVKPTGMAIINDVVYFNISPVVLIILTLFCYYILRLIKRFAGTDSGGDVRNIEITADDRKISFAAKVDTGCNLREPFSGHLVIVVERKLLDGYVPSDSKKRIIPFSSLGGSGIIEGFAPKEIIIDGIKCSNDVYIGICENIIKGEVGALIPAELATKQK